MIEPKELADYGVDTIEEAKRIEAEEGYNCYGDSEVRIKKARNYLNTMRNFYDKAEMREGCVKDFKRYYSLKEELTIKRNNERLEQTSRIYIYEQLKGMHRALWVSNAMEAVCAILVHPLFAIGLAGCCFGAKALKKSVDAYKNEEEAKEAIKNCRSMVKEIEGISDKDLESFLLRNESEVREHLQ